MVVSRAGRFVVEGSFLIRTEGIDVQSWGGARHSDELGPVDQAAPSTQWNQFRDLMPVSCDCERLTALNGVHDLFGSIAEISSSDLGLRAHVLRTSSHTAPCATW